MNKLPCVVLTAALLCGFAIGAQNKNSNSNSNTAAKQISDHPVLASKLQSMLPAGTSPRLATSIHAILSSAPPEKHASCPSHERPPLWAG